MDQNLKDFLLTGWTDMGSGYALAIHPDHRTMYGGSIWVLIDTVKGRPDVYFGPESLFGDAPISGKVIAQAHQVHHSLGIRSTYDGTYCCNAMGGVDFLPDRDLPGTEFDEEPQLNPAISDRDFGTFLSKIRALLPKRDCRVRLGTPLDRARAIKRQLMIFEFPDTTFTPNTCYHHSMVPRASTVDEKVDQFFMSVLMVDCEDPFRQRTEPLLEAIIQHGSNRKAIFETVLNLLGSSGLADAQYGMDLLVRFAVERRLTRELDAMEAPFGFVYVSPDGIDIAGWGEEKRVAHRELKHEDYRGWRLMIGTKRYIQAMDRFSLSTNIPEPNHRIVNGLVDLAGIKPTRGPKRKLSAGPKLEWHGKRLDAWRAVRIDGKSLRAVAKELGVGAATLHRAIKPLDAYADLMVPGAVPMPGEDDSLGDHMMQAHRCAYTLRRAGFTANHFHAHPVLSKLIVGEVDKPEIQDVERQIIKAWLDGILPATIAAEAVRCDDEKQLRNLAHNLGAVSQAERAAAQ